MKTTAMTLALILGLSALNTLAQEDGGARRRDEAPAQKEAPKVERQERRAERTPAVREEARRGERRDEAAPRQAPKDTEGPRAARGDSEDRRPEGRAAVRDREQGQAPALGSARRQGFNVCPQCNRPLGLVAFQRRMGQGGQGFGWGGNGPRYGQQFRQGGQADWLDQGGPGFGRGWRGQGFGPQAFRGNGQAPLPPRDGFGPMRRGFGGPQGRLEQDGTGFQGNGRGPGFGPPAFREDRQAPTQQGEGFGPRRRGFRSPVDQSEDRDPAPRRRGDRDDR